MALSKVLLEQDRFAKLVKTSNTVVTLGSITVTTSVSGAGGLDTGSIAASTFYYVYTVLSAGAVKIIASTSASGPTGFTTYRKVGAFYTDGSSNIFRVYFYSEVNTQVMEASITNNGTATIVSQSVIQALASVTRTTTGTVSHTFNSGLFTVAPVVSATSYAGQSRKIGVDSTTTTNTITYLTVASANTLEDNSYSIAIFKQGIDSVQPDWSR